MSTERDESLFRALVEGEIEESSPKVREMFANNPEYKRRWQETRDVFSALEQRTRERDEVLAHASELADAPGMDRAEQALRGAMLGTAAPSEDARSNVQDGSATTRARLDARTRTSRARPWIWVLAAAAVLVTTLIAVRWKNAPADRPRDVLLGAFDIDLHAIIDATTGEARFAWTGKLPPGTQYVLTVQGKSTDAAEWRDAVPPFKLSASEWRTDKATASAWPPLLRARVTTLGGESQSPWSYFSRSR
jgi:hypothetical protein